MSKNFWFTGDTHYGHKEKIDKVTGEPRGGVIRFSNRPFATIEEHDEILIENHNRVVSPKDDVFHLGDLSYLNKDMTLRLRKRLNGNFFFIEGNHDAAAHQIRHTFGWYKNLHMTKVNSQEIVLCHFSMETWNKSHYGAWHAYGHSHASLPDRANRLSLDVGVDAVAMRLIGKLPGQPISGTKPEDYRPISFDEIAVIMATKKFEPIDHHGIGTSNHDLIPNDSSGKELSD